MTVRTAKQHRRARSRPHRDLPPGEPVQREGDLVAGGDDEPAGPGAADVVSEPVPFPRRRVRRDDDLSVDARLGELRDALHRLRAAFHDVTEAAGSLARGELRAFARVRRRLRARAGANRS